MMGSAAFSFSHWVSDAISCGIMKYSTSDRRTVRPHLRKVFRRAAFQDLHLRKLGKNMTGSIGCGGDALHCGLAAAVGREAAGQFAIAAADLEGVLEWTWPDC
jgi:hypothetical protein